MAGAPKRPTHEMIHARRYLSVEGEDGKRKLQHVPKGTLLSLSNKEAKRMGNTVRPLSERKAVDMTSDEKPKEK